MKNIMLVATLCSFTALSPAFAQGNDSFVVLSLGGTYQEAQSTHWFKPYSAETGVNVTEAAGYNFANLRVMIQSGNVEADLVDLTAHSLNALAADGLLEPIDWSVLPESCTAGIPEEMRHDYAFPTIQWGMLMAYNTETYPEGPQSWADFWDTERFPGKRGSIGATNPPVEQATMALGSDIADLYPLDIDAAFAKIAELGNDITFSDGYAQVVQFFADGEVDMIVIPNGRVVPLINSGAPVAIQWNQHLRYAQYLAIPKGAANADAAMEFLAWVCQPEVVARLAEPLNYGPINSEAYDFVPEAIVPLLPGSPATADQGRMSDSVWMGEHRQDIARGWARLAVR